MDGNGKTTTSQVKVWNHPTETTILKWMFWVPGRKHIILSSFSVVYNSTPPAKKGHVFFANPATVVGKTQAPLPNFQLFVEINI